MNYGLLMICHIFLKRVMPLYYKDESEVEVLRFWIDRLQREYRDPIDEVDAAH